LISKSLVVAETQTAETRFHLLEMIREYALDELRAAGREHAARAKHLAYFLELAEDAALRLWGRATLATLERLEREHDNLRAALRFALDAGEVARAAQMAGALGDFWHLHSYTDQAERWYAEILERGIEDAAPIARARLYSSVGTIAWDKADFARAEQFHRRALTLYETIVDAHGIALSLNNIGVQLKQMGKVAEGRQALAQALELARAANDPHAMVFALNGLGALDSSPESLEQAEMYLGEALLVAEREGDASSLGAVASNLAEIARLRGDFARAEELLEQALLPAYEIGNFRLTHFLLRELGSVLALRGNFERAGSVLRKALQLAQKHSDRWTTGASFSRLGWFEELRGSAARAALLSAYSEACLERIPDATLSQAQMQQIKAFHARLRETLGEESFQREWKRGRAMTDAQATALVFEEVED